MRMSAASALCGFCMTMMAAGDALAADHRLTDGELDRITAGFLGDVPYLSELAALLDSDTPGLDLLMLLALDAGLTVPTLDSDLGIVAEQTGTEAPLLDLVLSLLPETGPSLAALVVAGGGATTSDPIVTRGSEGIDSQVSTSFVPGVGGTASASNSATSGSSGTASVPGVSSSVFIINY